MFGDLSDLRDSLLVARLLREEMLAAAVAPEAAARLREEFLAENALHGSRRAIGAAMSRGRARDFSVVDEDALTEIAAAAGSGERRAHAGAPFHGKAAPAPSRIPELLAELLETINSPVALETWSPPVRAFGLHFLLRLVQPFQAPADVVAHAAEAMLLAADGFVADHMLLVEPGVGAAPGATKPDPDAFVRERTHRFVERLGESRDRVRDAAARSLVVAWAERRDAGLNPRQRRLVKWLADKHGAPRIAFQDYVDLHAGRRAPSVRSLQRDFQSLRTRGLLRADGDGFVLDTRPVTFGG
jgi:hypothetical protein